jgi:hypothetical protein
MPTIVDYATAYFLSTFVVFGAVGLLMKVMRRTAHIEGGKSFGWLTLWVGGTERAVAMTLAFLVPHQVPIFIGGWIALKFAATWKRESPHQDDVVSNSLLSLVGSVWSFGFAMFIAWLIRPEFLSILAR